MIDRLNRQSWFLAGLFFTTLSTLTLEILNTRLLSVITWYHLSFFAVSVAMLGMAAGAVHVYLGGERFSGEAAITALARYSELFAVSIAVSHLFNMSIPILTEFSVNTALTLLLSTTVLGLPFYLSGMLVSLALTRIPGRIGVVYAVDLVGAALGCLLVFPLLDMGNITSAVFGCGCMVGFAAFGNLFSTGLRLVRRISNDALPWMWGVNGAASVLAGVLAVVVSMWLGIRANLLLAVGGYFLLILPMLYLWNKGRTLAGTA